MKEILNLYVCRQKIMKSVDILIITGKFRDKEN